MSERAGRRCPAGCDQWFLSARAAGQHLRREHSARRKWSESPQLLTDGGDKQDEQAETQALAEFLRR